MCNFVFTFGQVATSYQLRPASIHARTQQRCDRRSLRRAAVLTPNRAIVGEREER